MKAIATFLNNNAGSAVPANDIESPRDLLLGKKINNKNSRCLVHNKLLRKAMTNEDGGENKYALHNGQNVKSVERLDSGFTKRIWRSTFSNIDASRRAPRFWSLSVITVTCIIPKLFNHSTGKWKF